MKKVLISQKMGTKSAEEVWNERKELVEFLKNEGFEVLDNIFTDQPPMSCVNKCIYYLSKAVKLMTQANIIIFMHDWNTSRGCILEHEIATKYDLNIIHLDNISNTKEELFNSEDCKKKLRVILRKLTKEKADIRRFVKSDKLYSVQTYCEEFLGFCPVIKGEQDELRKIIDSTKNLQEIWDFPLDEIDEIVENNLNVVLVDQTYEMLNEDSKEYESIHDLRWFEIPKK